MTSDLAVQRVRRVDETDHPRLWRSLFAYTCCGLDSFVWTGNDGGAVWAVDHETIRIHDPEAVSLPTAEVDLGV